MTNKKLYLRIGQDKAGTTTIGMFVNANREMLLNHGVWAPLGNCAALIHRICRETNVKNFNFKPAVRRANVQQAVDRILAQRGAPAHDVLFLTTEALWGRMCVLPLEKKRYFAEAKLIAERLQQIFDVYDVNIMVHLRRADLHNESSYGQHIKAGGSQSIAQYTLMRSQQGVARNSEILLRLLADVFGRDRIVIKPFEREQFSNGDLIDDLLDTLGLEAARLELKRADQNERIHGVLIPVLRDFYAAGGARLGNIVTRTLSEYIAQTDSLIDVRTYYTASEREQVVAEYADFYRYVSDTFLAGRPVFLQPIDTIPAPHRYTEAELEWARNLLELVIAVARHGRNAARRNNAGLHGRETRTSVLQTLIARVSGRARAVARNLRRRIG